MCADYNAGLQEDSEKEEMSKIFRYEYILGTNRPGKDDNSEPRPCCPQVIKAERRKRIDTYRAMAEHEIPLHIGVRQ